MVASGPDVLSMIFKAEETLQRLGSEAVQERSETHAKIERASKLLLTAMEVVMDDETSLEAASAVSAANAGKSDSPAEILEKALAAAKQAGVPAELRVRAQKVLNARKRKHQRGIQQEANIRRLTQQLETLALARARPDQNPRTMAVQRQKAAQTMAQLNKALDDVVSVTEFAGLPTVQHARMVVENVGKLWEEEEKAELRFRNMLLWEEDKELLRDKLMIARQRHEAPTGPARFLAGQVEEKCEQILRQEQRQRWLLQELALASGESAMDSFTGKDGADNEKKSGDVTRLRQLCDQAKMLGLVVPPRYLAQLHELQSREKQRAHARRPPRDEDTHDEDVEDHATRMQAHAQRCGEAALHVVLHAEANPGPAELDLARQAIADAKASKVPDHIVLDMERRLSRLERKYGPQLQAETRLVDLLKVLDPDPAASHFAIVQNGEKIVALKSAVEEARAKNADTKIVGRAERLLERSLDVESQRRCAEELLMACTIRNPTMEQLTEAISEGQRCGIGTLHAEQALERLRAQKVMCEAAEAELKEALKGEGGLGRNRLEIAIKHAKCAGVGAQMLQPAVERLRELEQHTSHCALVAGNLRRALARIKQEPWRVQHILDAAKKLQPWTPELERLASQASEQLGKRASDIREHREITRELQTLLKTLAEGPSQHSHGENQLSGDGAVQRLSELIPRAKQLEVSEELMRDAEVQLKRLKREGCQRNVAEYRLKLALTARDLPEMKQAMREVRALGSIAAASSHATPEGKHSPQQSARLMEAASSMIRHLSDSEQRKQAAASALLSLQGEHTQSKDTGSKKKAAAALEESALPTRLTAAKQAHSARAPAEPGSAEWVKAAKDVVLEAKQVGVAPSLIEHARMKIREKRRECEERTKALEGLQKALAKKSVQKHELSHCLERVRAVGGAVVPTAQ
eukprot:TRINITY_DN16420_c0_g1_i2.p1 TRINITY_DN16420_c0_g1~~TRINITY_DN16420_c0_g1_i2.p1  ORF type:complete len:925 (+),score=318.71 TRINITY_DN16420_c0_g1_i2:71-2845(+)